MGKGLGDERPPLDGVSKVPEALVTSRELVARDIGFSLQRDGTSGLVRLRHHSLPQAWHDGPVADPSLWRVGHPYPSLSGTGTTLLGGLLLVGADLLGGHDALEAHGMMQVSGRACARLWQFSFRDGAAAGIDLSETATACTCSMSALVVCPHQAFAIFYQIAGFLRPVLSKRIHAADGAEVNRLAAWLAMREQGVSSGELLAEALEGFYSEARREPFTILIDSARVEAAITP